MDEQSSIGALMQERAVLVARCSEFNARLLRARQVSGGAEIDVMRLETEIETEGETEARRTLLVAARSHAQTAQDALVAWEESIEALARRIEALDRRILEDSQEGLPS